MRKRRSSAYFDGSNFYHNCKSCFGVGSVDLKVIAEQILRPKSETITAIHYFTAPVNQQEDSEGYARQLRFLQHVRNTESTKVHLGKLVKRPLNKINIECSRCGHQRAKELICPRCSIPIDLHRISRLSEKGVYVQIAMNMLLDAIDDRYDVALLFSGDADFSPAIRYIIDRLGKEVVYCRFPNKATNELIQVCTGSRTISEKMIRSAKPNN